MDKNTGKSVEESFKAEMDRATAAKAGDTTPATTVPTGTQQKDATASASPTTTVEPAKYKLPDGREVPADQVLAEYNNLHKDYTVKTQKLAELEKQPTLPTSTTPKAQLAPEKGATTAQLSEVDQRMRSELKRLGAVFPEDLDATFEKQKPGLIQDSARYTRSQIILSDELDKLVTENNGVDGKPKMVKEDIVSYAQKRNLQHLAPVEVARLLYHDDVVKWEARGLAGQAGQTASLPVTEKTGANVTDPPKPPANALAFNNGTAERAVSDMLGIR